MSNPPYFYKIEISNKEATMKFNGNVVLSAKVNKEYFWEIYHITETLTGKTFAVKTFKRSLYYWGTERIEVRDELNELILTLSFKFYMVQYVFFKIFLSANDKGITLDNPEKKEMIYMENDKTFTGSFEYLQFVFFTYEFEGENKLENMLYMFMFCFCHSNLDRPER